MYVLFASSSTSNPESFRSTTVMRVKMWTIIKTGLSSFALNIVIRKVGWHWSTTGTAFDRRGPTSIT